MTPYDMKFSQASGFTDFFLPEALEQVESLDEWMKRVGYKFRWMSKKTWEPDEEMSVMCLSKRTDFTCDRDLPEFCLVVGDDYGEHHIYTDTVSDMFALRLLIMPLVLEDVRHMIERLEICAGKAFRSLHGHSVKRPCAECDPDGYKVALAGGEENPQET